MRIVAIAAARVPSATANSIQVMKACAALSALGHEVRLLLPGPDPLVHWDELARAYGLQGRFGVEWLPGRGRRRFTWQAARKARALRADLVYAWPPQAAVFALLSGLPVVFEAHEPPSGTFGPLWWRLFLRLPGRRRVAAITRALKDLLERRYGRPRDGLTVVAPNGVELERFAGLPGPSGARSRLGLPDRPTVMCTGHLYAGRGADLFLALARALPQAHFVWVGGRPQDVADWQARAQAQRLANLTFSGHVPNQDLPLWQSAADVLLMPYARAIAGSSGGDSAAVASPMKMFEYMAAGRAILSSDLPVIREVLDENSAVLCPPEDLAAWTRALGALLDDPARRAALGQSARSLAAGYTWTGRAGRILEGFTHG